MAIKGWIAIALAIGAAGVLAACSPPPPPPERQIGPGPNTEAMSADQMGQTDFNRTVTVEMRDNLATLYALADKLYRRNPREWHKSGATNSAEAVKRLQHDVDTRSVPPALTSLRDIQILTVSLDPKYSADRVQAFIYGLADTLITAHNGKTRFYASDLLDGQRVYNAARNVEIAAWLLATRRDASGAPLLLSDEKSDTVVNLSFQRSFGEIIGRLDLIANLLGENTRRIGINYAQSLLFFRFLPVR